jgi:small nuclear ribonucleoprotein (snRNP)-like protein
MAETVGPREKAILTQTLAPLLCGLVGKRVVIELKNELQVKGLVTAVDW